MRVLARVPLFLLAVCVALCLSSEKALQATNSYLTERDRAHLKKVLEPGWALNDIPSTYHAILGYKFLEEPVPNVQKTCDYIVSGTSDESSITAEKSFYAAVAWRTLGNCKVPLAQSVSKILRSTLENESSTIEELYYATSGLTALSEKLPRDKIEKISKAVENALRKDDSLWNLGYAFHIASDLDAAGAFAFNRIEDGMVQADEVDGQYLQFEGGLSVTSFLVNGILKLSATLKKKPPLTAQQTVKIANYLLSRRTVQTPKGAVGLLSALHAVALNGFEKPICITLPEGGISVSHQQPLLTVKICDILGNPLTNMPSVFVNSAMRLTDGPTFLMKESLRPSATDKTLFTMNFINSVSERGFYKVSISAGTVTSTVVVKVLSEVVVDYLEIGTGDADQTTQPKLTRVLYPETLAHKIEADYQQKLVMRFHLKDASTKESLRAHQAFVRLSSVSKAKPIHEIIFVAEPDASQVCKFDMPVAAAAANFAHRSGDYNVELIVGDATISNPFQWSLATVNLKFPDPTTNGAAEKNASFDSERGGNAYTTKPEIKHMFRQPEKRPPAFVSNLFTGLCLAPILLLFILWAKLGVNISNFPMSLSAIVFHTGLASIFVLFGVFWLRLNMFVTLRYLLGLGVVTFLAGNKMLSRIALRNKLSR